MQGGSKIGGAQIVGYWQVWEVGGERLPLEEVPCEFSRVILAFAAPDETGELQFAGGIAPLRRSVERLQKRAQKVLLSLGGGGVPVVLTEPEVASTFSRSLREMVCALGVDGVDIDVELGMPAGASPEKPEGTAAALIVALDELLARMPPDFELTMAPETANLVGGIQRYGGPWGNYLPLILHFGRRITQIHMQYYNSGSMRGLDGRYHQPGTIDFVSALTRAVIEGFPIADTGVIYPGMPPDRVAIGLPASPTAAANGYLPPEAVQLALHSVQVFYPKLRGAMTWSVQLDQEQDYQWLCNVHRYFCDHPFGGRR